MTASLQTRRILSLLLGGSYLLNDTTDLVGYYSFSSGDYSQGNTADGLPLGIDYELHSLQAGISTLVLEKVRLNLQYLYQHYEETSSGDINDYTAHGIFANCSVGW